MRDSVAKVRLRPEQDHTEDMLIRTYSTAMSTAAAELILRWNAGVGPPGPDARLEVAKAINEDGHVRGFNVYLVWGEPVVLGARMKEEMV